MYACVCILCVRTCFRGPVPSNIVDYLGTCLGVSAWYRSSPTPLHAQSPRAMPLHDMYIIYSSLRCPARGDVRWLLTDLNMTSDIAQYSVHAPTPPSDPPATSLPSRSPALPCRSLPLRLPLALSLAPRQAPLPLSPYFPLPRFVATPDRRTTDADTDRDRTVLADQSMHHGA